jgi:hypothetical protein
MSFDVSVAAGAAAATASEPLSEGASALAAGAPLVGVATGAPPDVDRGAATGFEPPLPLSAIIVCTAYAMASASTQHSAIAIFFCFAAFAFAASAGFCRATFCSSRAD